MCNWRTLESSRNRSFSEMKNEMNKDDLGNKRRFVKKFIHEKFCLELKTVVIEFSRKV